MVMSRPWTRTAGWPTAGFPHRCIVRRDWQITACFYSRKPSLSIICIEISHAASVRYPEENVMCQSSVVRGAWCVVRVRRAGQCGRCGQGKDILPHPTTVRIITTGTVALLFKPAPPAPVPNALRTTHYAPHSPEPCTTEN